MSNTLGKILQLGRREQKPSCAAVVLAAGGSVRMGSDKILAKLGEIPVLARALRPFQDCEYISEIVVVTSAEKLMEVTELCREYNIGKVSKVVSGGKTRAESALTGVSEVSARAELTTCPPSWPCSGSRLRWSSSQAPASTTT